MKLSISDRQAVSRYTLPVVPSFLFSFTPRCAGAGQNCRQESSRTQRRRTRAPARKRTGTTERANSISCKKHSSNSSQPFRHCSTNSLYNQLRQQRHQSNRKRRSMHVAADSCPLNRKHRPSNNDSQKSKARHLKIGPVRLSGDFRLRFDGIFRSRDRATGSAARTRAKRARALSFPANFDTDLIPI